MSLPDDMLLLATRRFDRDEEGGAVHAEDLAQALGLRADPNAAYRGVTYAGIARFVSTLMDADDHVEFARRLVFMVLSGNGDAHAKNWGIFYPDGIHARLSPAYDLVFTRSYVRGSELALKMGRAADRSWGSVTRASLLSALAGTGVGAAVLQDTLGTMVETATARLGDALARVEAPPDSSTLQALRTHLEVMRVALGT
ncbi:MAG: HipA domain-containing protein [Deltaproteobacteria bacterium]|nr:HipA domain-containing protein [Deltaproteobacteria bacterium]